MSVELSVVIPTRDRAETLGECLTQLVACCPDHEGYEIVVVDDGSNDRTPADLDRWQALAPHRRVIHQEPRGPAAARNAGCDAARGWIVLFLGDDTFATTDLVTQHLAFHRHQGRRCPAMLGAIESAPATVDTPVMRWIVDHDVLFRQGRLRPDRRCSFWYFHTAHVSIERERVLAARFDEGFTAAAWEDIELAFRLHQMGLELTYVPTARVTHHHRYSFAQYARARERAGRAYALLVARHPVLDHVKPDLLNAANVLDDSELAAAIQLPDGPTDLFHAELARAGLTSAEFYTEVSRSCFFRGLIAGRRDLEPAGAGIGARLRQGREITDAVLYDLALDLGRDPRRLSRLLRTSTDRLKRWLRAKAIAPRRKT